MYRLGEIETSLLFSGKVFSLILFVLILAVIFTMLWKAKTGRVPNLKNIPGLDVLKEAVGRAVELGQPIHFTPGRGKFDGADVPAYLASLDILRYVADLSAKNGARLMVTHDQPSVIPLVNQIVHEAYLANQVVDDYDPEDLRYIPGRSMIFEMISMFEREKIASNIIIGPTYYETIIICEQGYYVGAMQISGTTSISQLPFMIATSSYVLIGEEMLVAGAYLSQNAEKLGSIEGQDYAKMGIIALTILTAILSLIGMSPSWLSM